MDNKMNIGHVFDMTEYFNQQVKDNKIIGIGESYKHGYYICRDVFDMHVYRIQVGINAEYEDEPRTKIIEQEDIPHDKLQEFCEELGFFKNGFVCADVRDYPNAMIKIIGLENLLKAIVAYDYENGFGNYDVQEFRYDTPMSELIDIIDGGYGITKFEPEAKRGLTLREYRIHYRVNGQEEYEYYDGYTIDEAFEQCFVDREGEGFVERVFVKTENGWEEIPDWQWADSLVEI